MTAHLLAIADLDAEDLRWIVDAAGRTELPKVLDGGCAALIFEKPSLRTRHSMEVAVVQLGGHPVYTRGEEIGFDQRESVEDISRVLGGYHELIAARVFSHSVVERIAAVSTVPVINMLSDHDHPLQALADVRTMTDHHGDLAGQRIAFVGDYNNVSRSLAEACVLLGADLVVASPPEYGADQAELERVDGLGPGTVTQVYRAAEAVDGAIAVHADTWTSMGQEHEKAGRERAFEAFRVDGPLMATAASGAGFYHCLPAYRGKEVAADVIDGPASRVIAQAHHRLSTARAAIAYLKGVR